MYKCLFTKWKMLGKYHIGFAFNIITTQWALPINIEWTRYKLYISILCFILHLTSIKLERSLIMSSKSNPREMVQIPRFVVDRAIEALRMNHNNINCECCLKRMTASAHNLLKVYTTEGATEADIENVITSYTRGELLFKQYRS